MGKTSKQMVFKVYENYVEGQEEDAENICECIGKDFIMPRKKKNPVQFRHSTGHSQQVSAINI